MLNHPEWMSKEAIHTLSNGYLLKGETPRGLFERASNAVEKRLAKMYGGSTPFPVAEELYHCLWNGWLGLSSPFASNMGTNRGLPISCYGIDLSDSVASIYSHLKEAARMSQEGGGTSVYLGNIRPSGSPISKGGVSTGIVPWARNYDVTAATVNQGGVRRGSFAFYIPIDHPDLRDLLRSKDHTQGDPRKHIDSNIAVTITDAWMESMLSGDKEKFDIFSEVLYTRLKTGTPYLFFTDNVNNSSPECYKLRSLLVSFSNICTEITLFTDESHSFVCALMSLNLARYDEWKNWVSPSGKTVPQLAVYALEALMEEFIAGASGKVGMGRAVRSAIKGRPIGVGSMGLHLLYQKRGYPYASPEARSLNIECHKLIAEEALKASKQLAQDLGEPEWCEGHGIRHTHLTAIAPTKTNAVISGAFSEGILPVSSNIFGAVQAKGTYIRKNPVLEEILESKGKNTPEVWSSVVNHGGSVQHLKFLSEKEKECFLTAREIDQKEVVKQAADRQPYVDQSQSLSLSYDSEVTAKELLETHILGWKLGVKTFYYLKSKSSAVRSSTAKAFIVTKEGCPWCVKLKEELQKQGIDFSEVDKSEARNFKWSTVPQLWLDGEYIGGYSDFMSISQEPVGDNEETCKGCEA